MDDNSAQAGHLVAAAITAREGKGPDSDATTTLLPVAFDPAQITSPDNRTACRPGDPAPTLAPGGRPHVTHALTAEGHDASEDGTGRSTPLVPMPIALRGRDGGGAIEAGEPGDPAFTVRTPAGGSSYPMVAAAAVRRLTPLECERLQGFPDGWTTTSNGKAQADAARYRELGNAVAVPVVEWIARRIVAVDAKRRERPAA